MPQTSIIILNWNQPELTVSCVKSVLQQDNYDFEILIVDNASTDNSIRIFIKEFSEEFLGSKKIKIITNSHNLGYAGGNNAGVNQATGEYIVILNNDAVVQKDWLKYLVEGMESDPSIGSVSSTEIRNGVKVDHGYITLSLTGRYITYPTTTTDLLPFFGVKGVSFIYRKSTLDLPFDPDYFIYAEDTYLGWLLQLKGYKNKISTKSIVHHLHNTSKKGSSTINKHFIYLGERNTMLNFFLFYEIKNMLKILPLMMIRTILMNLMEPRKIPYRTKSYVWLVTHMDEISERREGIQNQRRIPDSEIIGDMSCKFQDESRVSNGTLRGILRIVNKFSEIYCKLVGLNVLGANS